MPSPAEWWFNNWQVQQKVWPLTEGAGVTIAVLDTGVQASIPDLRGAVLTVLTRQVLEVMEKQTTQKDKMGMGRVSQF